MIAAAVRIELDRRDQQGWRVGVGFALLVLLASAEAHTQQQFTLTAVHVFGAERHAPDEVVALAGLAVGHSLTVVELDQAVQRMAQSGLFVSVQYRYTTTGNDMEVTLEVEEGASTIHVVFDNFVGFDDQVLSDAVRQVMPSFDRYAPDASSATETIARALQGVLDSRGFTGTVEFVPSFNLVTRQQAYLFRIAEAATDLSVCELRFDGTDGVFGEDLLEAVPDVVGNTYSRSRVLALSEGTWRRVYRERGFWAVSFGAPSATLDGERCSGVSVTVSVDEGVEYEWAGAVWTGAAAVEPVWLDDLMDMREGGIASVREIEGGLRKVKLAYGELGYILMDSSFAPELDESTRSAVFEVALEEGPQFRMGVLKVEGLAADEEETVRRRWDLTAGEPYDDSYLSRFNGELARTRWGGLAGDQMELRFDQQQHVVNVTLRFDSAR